MGYSIPSFAVSRFWFQEAGICSLRFASTMSTSSRPVLIDTQRSLNTGVSSGKNSGAPNLGEQVHKIRDRSRIELLHNLNDPVPKIFIRESFTEPVKLFDRTVPRQWFIKPALVAVLLL